MRSERSRPATRWRRIAARTVALLIALDVAIVLALWRHGPLQVGADALPIGRWLSNPVFVLPALVLVWCALAWPGWRGWIGLPVGRRLRWRGVPLRAWLVLPVSIVFFAAQVRDLPRDFFEVTYKVRGSERKGPAGMSLSSSARHAAPLLRRLVRRERSDPVVVWIQDRDMRGHVVAYYLYPRLLLMEPRLRRYTLRRSMASRAGGDPYFFVGVPPPMSLSREFAEARGAEFFYAGRNGEREPR